MFCHHECNVIQLHSRLARELMIPFHSACDGEQCGLHLVLFCATFE